MSHELRTPLNHIMGFTELLLAKHFGELNQHQQESLSDVYRSSQHLLALVNEVLDLAKIESGRIEIRPVPIPLRNLLEGSLSIIADKALKKGISLTARIEEIPETIWADETRLRQVLYNLLANAVKFTDRGGAIVLGGRMLPTQRNATGDAPGGEIEISVQDSGIGISPAALESIFEPFVRMEGALSSKFPGTGLGLTLARNLVQLHGGRIWGESAGPGKGATFRFTLPTSAKADAAWEPPQPKPSDKHGHSAVP